MIIDTHYHMIPQVGTKASRFMARWPFQHAEKLGIPVDFDTLASKIKDIAADPAGEKLLARMDETGIDITMFCAVDDCSIHGNTYNIVKDLNEKTASIAGRSPSRLVALAGIDPRRPEAPALLKYCLDELGMKGLKLHPDHGYYPNSPGTYRMLEILQERDGILLTHTGPSAPPGKAGKYANPMLLDEVAVDFPGLVIIAAHMGQFWWREWVGSAYYHPNLYGDLAEWQILARRNLAFFRKELRTIIDICGVEKILFGSDGPIFELIAPVAEWLKTLQSLPDDTSDGIQFTREEVDAILGGNAQRILKLQGQG